MTKALSLQAMSDSPEYSPAQVEAKWQARWREQRTNEPDLQSAARPFYNLMMFPYPSAEGLHTGNVFAYTGADVFGRFQRQRGYNVFEPIGFDAFGIHSENYAIKVGLHPSELIPRNIANFRRQLTRMGGMFSWDHALSTTDPGYYKWTQWLFVRLFKQGLAYQKNGAVNWCPGCKTVLSNEQVIAGECERCGSQVEQRILTQWYFRITDYASRLLEHLDRTDLMDWSATTVQAQRNWIGRSEGAEIDFRVNGTDTAGTITVFTTRPDTLFGATFLVLAPEHPLVEQITTSNQQEEVRRYRTTAETKDLISRKVGEKEKSGVFTGAFAINPLDGRQLPIWIADYVLMDYGTGAIMAVPGHDQRDFAFASKYQLPIIRVIADDPTNADTPLVAAMESLQGYLVNSGSFDGTTPEEAKLEVTAQLEAQGSGRRKLQYRLYDWCISRQRYWGPPIPIIYCEDCGPVPVPEDQLPVLLPPLENFRPDDSGISPLARNSEWYHVPCPACGKPAHRETDVSDTFLDSAWYFLRYPCSTLDSAPYDPDLIRKWLPVDSYIGGNEHAVLHLLYSRFITMALHDAGELEFEEPFRKFRAHGLIVKDGAKMSKSRGNVVVPDEYIEQWGADTFRTYLMFLGPFEEGGDFRDAGISGPRRFLEKIWDLVGLAAEPDRDRGEIRHEVMIKWHQTKEKVTHDLERLSYNTAISALMTLVGVLREQQCAEPRLIGELVQMVAPFAPHFAEECWERLGHNETIFDAPWPTWDPALLMDETVTIAVQIAGKTRGTITLAPDADETTARALAGADPKIGKYLEGKEIRKVIFVPGRMISYVLQ